MNPFPKGDFFEDEWGAPGAGEHWREVNAYLDLWTGGVPGADKANFFRLHATAYDKKGDSNIPPAMLNIDGMPCDAEGNVYHVLEDNIWEPCTVFASFTHYSFAVTPAKATLIISRGGDITDQTNTVVVGEQIALTCKFVDPVTGADFSIAPITNFQWTVPGNRVKDYVPTATNGTVYYLTNASDFTNSGITYHWVQGSSGSLLEVQCTAKVKGETMTAKTKFMVRGVSADLTAQVTDVVHVTNNTLLRFAGASNGMRFTYSNPTFDGYTGSYKFLFVQTGTNFEKGWLGPLGGWISTSSGLDTDYPYDEFFNTNTARTFDSPSSPLSTLDVGFTRSDQYTMWLMFQPTSVTSRPVPLRSLSWSWNGTVTNTPPWTLTSSSPTTAGAVITGTATTSYPEWITNITSRTLIYWP